MFILLIIIICSAARSAAVWWSASDVRLRAVDTWIDKWMDLFLLYIIIIIICGRWILGSIGGWGVQWMASVTGGATGRTLAQTFEAQSVSRIQIAVASDYTWFPLHPPSRNAEAGRAGPDAETRCCEAGCGRASHCKPHAMPQTVYICVY